MLKFISIEDAYVCGIFSWINYAIVAFVVKIATFLRNPQNSKSEL